MDVEVGGAIAEHSLDQRLQLRTVDAISIYHHVSAVEGAHRQQTTAEQRGHFVLERGFRSRRFADEDGVAGAVGRRRRLVLVIEEKQRFAGLGVLHCDSTGKRSEEHTSELQSIMRISYAVFCLKK